MGFDEDHRAACVSVVSWRLAKGPVANLLPADAERLGTALKTRSTPLDGPPTTLLASEVVTGLDARGRPIVVYEGTSFPERFYVRLARFEAERWLVDRYGYGEEREQLLHTEVEVEDGQARRTRSTGAYGTTRHVYTFVEGRVTRIDFVSESDASHQGVFEIRYAGERIATVVQRYTNGYARTVFKRMSKAQLAQARQRVQKGLVRAVAQCVTRVEPSILADTWAIVLAYSFAGDVLPPVVGLLTNAERVQQPDAWSCWNPAEHANFDNATLELDLTDDEREAAALLCVADRPAAQRELLVEVTRVLNSGSSTWVYAAVDLEGVDWRGNVVAAVPTGRRVNLPL